MFRHSPLFITLFVLLSQSTRGAEPTRSEKLPPFVTLGCRLYIRVALPEEPMRLVKVLEFGPEQWIRVEELVYKGQFDKTKHEPNGTGTRREHWLNFAMVGAAGLFDEQLDASIAVGTPQSNASLFPKVGTAYIFGAAQVSLPYFAKVLETLPSGWFRVQLLPFRKADTPPSPKQLWINRDFVSRLHEAIGEDIPK